MRVGGVAGRTPPVSRAVEPHWDIRVAVEQHVHTHVSVVVVGGRGAVGDGL